MNGTLISVNVGSRGVLPHGRREIETAFVKAPITGPVQLARLGLPGDDHVYEHHGGPDMALLAYPIEHYAHWRSLGLDLPEAGAMAENLTVAGLIETEMCIGDVLACGEAQVQISQPRSPCFKLAARFSRRSLPQEIQSTGYTGFLLRVLTEGTIEAGDEVLLIERIEPCMTVARAGHILNVARDDLDGARELLDVEALGSVTRRTLEARVAAGGFSGEDTARLYLDDAL
ncbi:MAG: MOSC domain-containing protein [Actinobacteria bacterium]|nr:MOSC domain-containing protein [Actinomycetota bacterium]